jgi:hypothetical protein
MKLPTEIRLLNHVYKVMEVDEITDTDPDTNQEESILGLLDDTNLQILVVKSLHPSRKYQVFLHELLHAMFNIIELRRLLKDPESEETIVNFISDNLLHVLTDNGLKFPKKRSVPTLKTDLNLANSILENHSKGVSIADLCKTFQVNEKEVKQLLKTKLKQTKKKIKK